LPDSRQRMGIDVEQVRARNPNIIYARGHGYGTRGEMATHGGFDLAADWARGGIGDAYAGGDREYPPPQRPAFGDSYGGLALAAGVVGALLRRARTGEPAVVDVSLLNAAIWQLGPDIVGAGITGEDVPRFDFTEMPNPAVNLYETRDGRFVAFVLLQADRLWPDFCTRLGRPDLIDDERYTTATVRFTNRKECIAETPPNFRIRGSCPLGKRIRRIRRGLGRGADRPRDTRRPQVLANGYLPRTTDANNNEFALAASPVQFDEAPLTPTQAPGHGEHTDLLLAELGFGEDEIIQMKIDSVVL
jgi:crotonobetainyl-CoA:carnitine CoA-transferase CaiB-like acyl-CoA transferase